MTHADAEHDRSTCCVIWSLLLLQQSKTKEKEQLKIQEWTRAEQVGKEREVSSQVSRVMEAASSARCSMEVRVAGNQACACKSSSLTEGAWLQSAVGLLPHTPPPAIKRVPVNQ